MFKKIFKGMLVLATIAMINNPANAFYTDMDESHWAYQSIKFLTEVGVVVGYPDGSYKPDIPVTRAEFASMAIKALGQESTSVAQEIHFDDITPDFWAYNIIQKAVYFDLIPDAKGESYRPFDSVTRAEALCALAKGVPCPEMDKCKAQQVLSGYTDGNTVPEWAQIPIATALDKGALNDSPNPKMIAPLFIFAPFYVSKMYCRMNLLAY